MQKFSALTAAATLLKTVCVSIFILNVSQVPGSSLITFLVQTGSMEMPSAENDVYRSCFVFCLIFSEQRNLSQRDVWVEAVVFRMISTHSGYSFLFFYPKCSFHESVLLIYPVKLGFNLNYLLVKEMDSGICTFAATVSKLILKYHTFNVTLLYTNCMQPVPNVSHLMNLVKIKQIYTLFRKCESTDLGWLSVQLL